MPRPYHGDRRAVKKIGEGFGNVIALLTTKRLRAKSRIVQRRPDGKETDDDRQAHPQDRG